jgi:hypothetical protein
MTITVRIKNFTKNELSCKCACKMFNMDEEFLIRLQAYRYLLDMPMNPTSACRCKKHNKAVGGVDTSCHQCETKQATAIDFTCRDLHKAFELARRTELFNEIIWYQSKNIIHLGLDRSQKNIYCEKKV